MLSGGSRSKGTIACLIAFSVLSARCLLLVDFAVVFGLSSPLSTTSSPFLAAHSSRKAPRVSLTKAKALSITSERFSSSRRAAPRRVNKLPALVSISAPAHHDPKPIVHPLRC